MAEAGVAPPPKCLIVGQCASATPLIVFHLSNLFLSIQVISVHHSSQGRSIHSLHSKVSGSDKPSQFCRGLTYLLYFVVDKVEKEL